MKRIIFSTLLTGWVWCASAGEPDTAAQSTASAFEGKYLEIGFGRNNSKFRDFATSPLYYKGFPMQVSVGYFRRLPNRETELNGRYSFGNYVVDAEEGEAISQVKTVFLNYSRLYDLKRLNTGKFMFRAGGVFGINGNLRINPSLQNNATGAEFFGTLSGSFKVSYDVSRVKSKEGKFLLFKYKRQPRKRELSFRLNPALMNISYRNAYIYTNHSPVIGDPKLFNEYEMKAFSGYRLSTALEYLIHLNNSNVVKFSYFWDAYHSGGDNDTFEMSNNIFQFSFLINLK